MLIPKIITNVLKGNVLFNLDNLQILFKNISLNRKEIKALLDTI